MRLDRSESLSCGFMCIFTLYKQKLPEYISILPSYYPRGILPLHSRGGGLKRPQCCFCSLSMCCTLLTRSPPPPELSTLSYMLQWCLRGHCQLAESTSTATISVPSCSVRPTRGRAPLASTVADRSGSGNCSELRCQGKAVPAELQFVVLETVRHITTEHTDPRGCDWSVHVFLKMKKNNQVWTRNDA